MLKNTPVVTYKADTLTATYKSDSLQLMLVVVDAEEHTRSDIQS